MTTGARRLSFIDALRGAALVLMVVNHTARDWLDPAMGWPRVHLIYASLLLPAALFLFLAGFSLPIAYRRAEPPPALPGLLRSFARRGLGIVGAGYLLNALILREQPLWSGGVLQTIGLAIVLAGALLPVAHHRRVQTMLVALVILLYLTFAAAVPALGRWSQAHPELARALFNDFPLWPWLGAAILGLVVGSRWLDARARGPAQEARFFTRVALTGGLCLAAVVVAELTAPTRELGFARDLVLNRHWTPRGTTLLFIVGAVAATLALSYALVERRRAAAGWLVVLGRTALMLYVVHQAIELTLVKELLGIRMTSWWVYAAATLALVALLVVLGRAWLAIRSSRHGGPAPGPPRGA
ncbi:MAG TPA: heparan-alpha-glucosaminide N-acetyltransferase domain-containing protein [Terriglobales bacterium]|nr:heparan-alpha-glucosaminide N-acetyltransferase domain-containing protein [Terriglobales bacterium]